MDSELTEYKNDTVKDIIQDLQMKPVDIQIINQKDNLDMWILAKKSKFSYSGFTKEMCYEGIPEKRLKEKEKKSAFGTLAKRNKH